MVNMSELQISLIAIGIVVVMGVIFFNWLQQRRYRRHAEEAFGQKHEDVLLRTAPAAQNERIEPRLGTESLQELPTDPDVKPVESANAAPADEPISEPVSEPISESAPAPPSEPSEPVLVPIHELIQPVREPIQPIRELGSMPVMAVEAPAQTGAVQVESGVDYVAGVHAATSIADSSLAEVLLRKFDFNKPVRWLGQRAADAPWEEIATQSHGRGGYANLKGCLQLVDRAGPISEVHLSEFRDMVQNFSARVNASADCPDVRRAHARALALDEFCTEVDVMIGINIISRDGGALTGAKIRVLAETSGLKLGADGMFGYRDENNAVLFYLGNFEPAPFHPDTMRTLTTHGVTFLLDVPRVAKGAMVFEQMVRLAENFADTLGGIMVDDNRIPLNDTGIQKIKRQLIAIESLMSARNIPAGGEIALRLFA
ncbi:MAG: cell division protein ZipA C-terminal FtsZ-binding domain-containing protein [Betaproteobacteria bacterium]|nr:cell division protein ZipA C-terminal FtsZ-binding domain-containing protein [Betaproteobacteria bacterium]